MTTIFRPPDSRAAAFAADGAVPADGSSQLPYTTEKYDTSRGSMSDQQLESDLIARLASTLTGSALAQEFQRAGMRIEIRSQKEIWELPGRGDARAVDAHTIVVNRDTAQHWPLRATVELGTAIAGATGTATEPGTLDLLKEVGAGMVLDPFRLRNPISSTIDRVYERSNVTPFVERYQKGAALANELGVVTYGQLGLRADGSVLSEEELKTALNERSPNLANGTRLMITVPLGAALGTIAGATLAMGASRMHAPRPNLIGAAAGVIVGAALVARDHQSHRRTFNEPEGVVPDHVLLDNALDRLASTESGREIADALRTTDVPIEVIGPQEMADKYGPAAGVYMPGRHKLVVSREELQNTDSAAALLGHEGVHLMDQPTRRSMLWGMVKEVPGALGDAVTAPFQLENPLGAFSSRMHDIGLRSEVNAYSREAQIEKELHIPTNWLATHPGGQLRTPEKMMEKLRSNEFYGFHGTKRLVTDLLFGTMGATVGAMALDTAIYKIRGKSPSLLIYGGLLGATTGLALLDYASHREPAPFEE